jgi:undecaprenyl diphosphate synthase
MEKTPKHVAIIPDGNRRWAKERGLEPWLGHEAGAKNIEEIIRKARELGIQELSLWGSSLENMTKRPVAEVQALLKIYQSHFQRILGSSEVQEGKVKIRIIGRWREQFPKALTLLLEQIEEKTKAATQHGLNIFLAYSGDDDMLNAVKILSQSQEMNVTKDTLKAVLMTSDLPPVDYMIRTGGDPHLSTGFMMWDTANAELYFTETLFPDFNPEVFTEAVAEYTFRARRAGA